MNLDVKKPPDRIKAIINHIKPSVMITETRFEEKLKNLDALVINIDRLDSIYTKDSQSKETLESHIHNRLNRLGL